MGQAGEDVLAEVFKVFEVGLADLAQEEALEARDALAVVGAHLSEEPVGFAAAASATVADGGRAVGPIAEAGGGTGRELLFQEDDAGADKVQELVAGTTVLPAKLEELLQLLLGKWRKRRHG